MPLTINVGLSRKASRDYQSTGVSINITAELDQALLAKPEELQGQIDQLYAQAEAALSRQVQEPARNPSNGSGNGRSAGHDRNGRGHGRRNGSRNGHGGMTESQRRAIESIAQRLDLDPVDEIDREFGWDLDGLTLREASQVIDHLKGLQTSDRGRD